MFQRFTDQARRVVVHAQQAARELKHNYIGTEHLLLGLIREEDGTAAQALAGLGVSGQRAREQVLAMVGEGEGEPTGHLPFTPRAKKVLELSLREALHLRHNYIGTEHILLGLVRETDGAGARALRDLGAQPERIRREVTSLLGGGRRDRSPAAPPTLRSYTPAAAEVLDLAEQLAAGSPLGSHHLLEALARSHRSAAAHALVATGVDVEVLAAKLDELGLEGTTDLTPEDEAARQMEIRLEGGEVHVVLRDEATVELVRAVTEHLAGPIRGTDPVVGGLAPVHQAVTRYLERLQRRLAPPDEETGSRSHSISAVIGQATRNRLRRRLR
jgi:ATP-dependent Clp protease ATP-binding subunit ClpC